ncbi:hypothetical protein BT96DRAFT_1050293, partial [Gymnopus androsaceus JB14]
KNYTRGYSDTQNRVRNATSNDVWGPSSTAFKEISNLTPGFTYFHRGDFVEIKEMLDKRLNDKGKNWRHASRLYFRRIVRS